jgi:HAD superfamily 5'-nucleotidase-like hydrolase
MTDRQPSSRGARSGPPQRERDIFCNRTLNLRAIRAIGYDMDYTLVHYRIEEWERRAYAYLRQKLDALGWPVDALEFDPQLVVRGLILDLEAGNILKVNRFGYVKRAYHGTHEMPFDDHRALYSRQLVDLHEKRYVFLNTLFSLSEACMYAQLVDRLDGGDVPGVVGYADLYRAVRTSIDEAHMEGQLKAEIMADPDRFVDRDPDIPLTLLDQRHAGKKLMVITNSEWEYTRAMLSYAFDPFLPEGIGWRNLFDLVIVSARKPSFFAERSPVFEIATDDGLVRPSPMGIKKDGVYLGGNARAVEDYLGVSGDEILYVGDHMYTDVHVSKSVLRWRTALIVRELDADVAAEMAFVERQRKLTRLMRRKAHLELQHARTRLQIQQRRGKYGPQPKDSVKALERRLDHLWKQLQAMDEEIAPLARAATGLSNQRWGLLMRAGNDKSHLARQIERYADVYTSRVSNFLYHTPFMYFRAPRGSLPHDPEIELTP